MNTDPTRESTPTPHPPTSHPESEAGNQERSSEPAAGVRSDASELRSRIKAALAGAARPSSPASPSRAVGVVSQSTETVQATAPAPAGAPSDAISQSPSGEPPQPAATQGPDSQVPDPQIPDSGQPGAGQPGAGQPGAGQPGAGQPGTSPQGARGRDDRGSRGPSGPRRPDRRRDDEADESAGPSRSTATAPRVPIPTRQQFRSSELDHELEAALGGRLLDDLLAKSEKVTAAPAIDPETRLPATVVRIHRDNVFFALGGPSEGVASLRQFDTPPEIGDRFDVVVSSYHVEDGLYEVAIPGASTTVGDWSDIVEGALVEARVTGANTGGLECMVGQIRGFIPASQVAMYRIENLADCVDQKLVCVVTQANPDRQNLVLSRRSVLEREKEEARSNLLASLEVGQVHEGIVRNIRDFGAFVDLGGLDGLIHISQLSWDRVNHPSEILELGQKVRVRVEKIDRETNRIGLSLRTLQEHPWEKTPELFPVGSAPRGVITRIADFGAFVKLAPGVEGLIHISELSHQRVANVSNVVREGQEVQVKVVSLDVASQRMGLSLKALAAQPEPESSTEIEDEAALPEPSAPRHRGPLRGGLGRGTGGDQFGLKW